MPDVSPINNLIRGAILDHPPKRQGEEKTFGIRVDRHIRMPQRPY
jgi:hypothetical protein